MLHRLCIERVMATIYLRKGKTIDSWRVIFRRKNTKAFCMSFATEEEARGWARSHEGKFLTNPEKYHAWIKEHRYAFYLKRKFPENERVKIEE